MLGCMFVWLHARRAVCWYDYLPAGLCSCEAACLWHSMLVGLHARGPVLARLPACWAADLLDCLLMGLPAYRDACSTYVLEMLHAYMQWRMLCACGAVGCNCVKCDFEKQN